MDNLESFIVFTHENEEFVLQNEQIVLNRYYREFNGKKSVDFITKSNFFQLLKELDCYYSVITSFLFIFQSQPKKSLPPKSYLSSEYWVLLFS